MEGNMKRFTKISLILCSVCLVLGLILLGLGSAWGARPEQYLSMVPRTSHFMDELPELDDLTEGESGKRHMKATGADQYDYDKFFPKDIRELHVSVDFGTVNFAVHGQEEIRVVANHAGKTFQCKVEGKELEITDKRKGNQEELELTIFLPQRELAELDLELGAGILGADAISVRELNIDVGGGECVIGTLKASESADLNVGAGRIQIDHFEGPKLDGDCGAGELVVFLAGSYTDYNYEVDVAMGEIWLGSHTYSGLANEQHIRNQAASNLELDCAMGSIRIDFEKETE